MAHSLAGLTTPALILDRTRMRRNIQRMSAHLGNLGGVLRPHVKTHKSIDVLREVMSAGNVQGITVSTIAEAEYFFSHGITDIIYGISISPGKLSSVLSLNQRGADVKVILDNVKVAEIVAEQAAAKGARLKVLIEIDTDGHRSGIRPDSEDLLSIGRILHENPATELTGVLSHAGESYKCPTVDKIKALARQDREAVAFAASRLREAHLPCPIVSIGSTPTACVGDSLEGVTETRAGVYTFFDLFQLGLNICSQDDLALSVLATVIGHQPERNWLIVDAGWMALSRDRGTAGQVVDQGFGAVLSADGEPFEDLIVGETNQEHGIIMSRQPGGAIDFKKFPLGSQLRIWPNHACATGAQHDRYNVIDDERLIGTWERHNGW